MNQLTLVIYLADIIPNLNVVLTLIVASTLSAYLIRLLFTAMHNDCYHDDWNYPRPFRNLWWLLIVVPILVFIPSKQTILLMAGSQFGQQIVETPQAKELLDGIQTVIKNQIDEYKKETVK